MEILACSLPVNLLTELSHGFLLVGGFDCGKGAISSWVGSFEAMSVAPQEG